TTRPWTSADVTSTCVTTNRRNSGHHRGSPPATRWKATLAGTGWVTRSLDPAIKASRRTPVTLSRWTKTLKSGNWRWDAQDDATNFQRNFNIGQVEVEDGVIYHKTEYRERRNHFAYFACSEPGAGS